ncbi:MAG: hypothetical protein AVDCRST_MAG38-652 [uncultured Solirubrobacteraceae bacterium]|uniref:Uncharacterized protein n=1 Tax=uncultured Solirubrobacteraceae bacterium TaxID=1162706 RepID=A0A6J4R839_9ACTN|nr:MAG: hypothetical protein AVDCRST_MAG38-652 [uncultured Solirubrobacteraceae bacterium]
MDRATLKAGWRRGQHGWPASFPIAQLPNARLLLAQGGLATAQLTDGTPHAYARAVWVVGLGAWAWGELAEGSSPFRRVLGLGGLVYVVAAVGDALGAGG